MKTFLINLDKDTERLISADMQLRRMGVNYERFSAIYAKNMPKNELDSKVNYFRFRCCVGRSTRIGEIGCALSHNTLYQRIITDNLPYVCVLEDDVVLSDDFVDAVNRVERVIDVEKPQVFLLSNYTNENESISEIKRVKNGYCTDGYIITRVAAKAILKENSPICSPCDHWPRWVKHKAIELYSVLPSVCHQNNAEFASNILSNGEKKINDMSIIERMTFYCRRIIEKTIDNILYFFHL